MPYPNIFGSLAGDVPATKLDENFNAAQLLSAKNAASGYVGLDASSNAAIAGNLGVGGNLAVTGDITVNDITGTGYSAITGAAATTRRLRYQTAGVDRWVIEANQTAESGGNTGSDLSFQSFTDGGSFIEEVFAITRSTGTAGFSKFPLLPGGYQAGYLNPPINDVSGNGGTYVLQPTDSGKTLIQLLTHAYAFTIFPVGTVACPVGMKFGYYNGPSDPPISLVPQPGVSLLWIASGLPSGTRTLATNGYAEFIQVATNVWIIYGGGGIT